MRDRARIAQGVMGVWSPEPLLYVERLARAVADEKQHRLAGGWSGASAGCQTHPEADRRETE